MVGTETAIVSNAYFIAGATVLLAGGHRPWLFRSCA